MVTDEQVRRLRQKRMQGKTQAAAAASAGMSERTARAWERGSLPSEAREPRSWRTRSDPFAAVWASEIEPLLVRDAEGVLESAFLFEQLVERYPDRFAAGQVRTLQRRVREWRALHGPAREVFFPQVHPPGREAQIDFTHASELGVTIAGVSLDHLLFELVLSASGWRFAQIAFGETFEALVAGVQGALWALGGVMEVVRSDNLSAATHELRHSGGRVLTERFVAAGQAAALPTLAEVLELEADDRQQRRITRLRYASKLPPGKTAASFDTTRLPPKLQHQLGELAGGGFLERSANVLAFGLPGTGKTHAVCALGHRLLEAGHGVYFTPAYRLVQELLAAKRDLALPRALRKLDQFEVLILDDLGYVQQDTAEADVLFTLLAERYERRSLVITSNLVFSQWDQIFRNPMATAAAIDRIVHHSVILEFDVTSYRTEAAKQRTKINPDPSAAARPMSQPEEPLGTQSPDLVGVNQRSEGKTSLKAGEIKKRKK